MYSVASILSLLTTIDVVNSVSMHPSADVIVTAAGQREQLGMNQRMPALQTVSVKERSSFKIWHKIDIPST